MKRLLVVAFLALAATVVTSSQASAQYPVNYGFAPWGFYQPYGALYGTSIKTPPYFATNPPVYYGARHARPYGLSPFASPPLVAPTDSYRSRLRSKFSVPPPRPSAPLCNPCVSHSKTIKPSTDGKIVKGPVLFNPFVEPTDQIAQK
jgi:hypothetical protein